MSKTIRCPNCGSICYMWSDDEDESYYTCEKCKETQSKGQETSDNHMKGGIE